MNFVYFIVITFLLSSCAIGTLNDFESGKTLGYKNNNIQLETNYGGNFQLSYMRGINDRFDLGASIEYSDISAYFEARGKYQLNSRLRGDGAYFSLNPTLYLGEGVGGSLGVTYSQRFNFFEFYLNPRMSYTDLDLNSSQISDDDFFNTITQTIDKVNEDLALALKVSLGANFYINEKFILSLGVMGLAHPNDEERLVDDIVWLPKVGFGLNF